MVVTYYIMHITIFMIIKTYSAAFCIFLNVEAYLLAGQCTFIVTVDVVNCAVATGSKEGKKSKKRDTKEVADESISKKKKKKSLLYVMYI